MNFYNPSILTGQDLDLATVDQVVKAGYQFMVASTLLAFGLVIFYFAFKTSVWFLPKFWQREEKEKKK